MMKVVALFLKKMYNNTREKKLRKKEDINR